MNRVALVLRYGISIAFWGLLLFLNYRTTQRSVLPLREALLLPHFVLPVSLIVLSSGFLVSGLLTRSRRVELFDTQATLSITSPLAIRVVRIVFAAAMLVSGIATFVGRTRPDLLYSTPGWGICWIALGALSLLNPSTLRGVMVEVSPAGIRHPQVRPAEIAWEDVAEIQSKRWLLSRFVLVIFREDADFHLQQWLWRWRKVKRLMFAPTYFGVDAETLANALKLRRDLRAF